METKSNISDFDFSRNLFVIPRWFGVRTLHCRVLNASAIAQMAQGSNNSDLNFPRKRYVILPGVGCEPTMELNRGLYYSADVEQIKYYRFGLSAHALCNFHGGES